MERRLRRENILQLLREHGLLLDTSKPPRAGRMKMGNPPTHPSKPTFGASSRASPTWDELAASQGSNPALPRQPTWDELVAKTDKNHFSTMFFGSVGDATSGLRSG